MDIQPPNNFRGGRPFFEVHQVGAPSALAWTIFALQLLLLAAIALLIARSFAFRPRPVGPPRRLRGRPDPLTHARLRYANGEISREEYLQVTQDLGGTPDELPPD